MKKICNLFLIFSFFVSLTLPCSAENPNFIKAYNQGLQAFKVKDYDNAIADFNNALKYNSNSYQTYCLLGMSYGSIGQIQKSEDILEKAVKLYPNEWKAYTFLGDIKKSQKNYPIAIEYYEKAISLPSLPADGKAYYKKTIEQTIQEQNNFNASHSDISLIKNNVELNLDWQTWQKSYGEGKKYNWVIEYGLKGEDVKNYKWTQLVTVQYYETNVYHYYPNEYLKIHLAPIEEVAQNTHKNFTKNIISQKPDEIIYEWSFDNGEESEVARLINTDKGLYHLHFAKKGIITPKEKVKWLNILKTAKINE